MRSRERCLAVSAAAMLLFGCATQNIAGTDAYASVPSSRIVGTLPTIPVGSLEGIIVVKRDPGLMGTAISSILLINGEPVAKLKPGEYIQLRMPAGEALFGVSWSDNLGALKTASTREVAIDVKAGQTYYVRMFPLVENGIAIERVSR